MRATNNIQPRFATAQEIADLTGMAYSTVRSHIDKGIIPMVRVGGRKLVPLSYLDDLEEQARQRNTQSPGVKPRRAVRVRREAATR
ncbi:helix-turn-helix domain-containing protein [Gordonia alkanivorans]|uniref:helix-turn-helix domain-containing protein n=1 Tax=Gordonia alkanivorans TaxID=84096 RepID=UPI003CC664FC